MKTLTSTLVLINLIGLCFLPFAFSCNGGCRNEQPDYINVNQFRYYRDDSTRLCFASYKMGMAYGLMTRVPCTPEVEVVIENQRKKDLK